MLLPYSIKVVWFALSFSGMLSCWVVLLAFANAVEAYWGPILYCIGVTILEGMFCLGIFWRMDPFLMPRSFCIAQTILFAFATFLLAGICTAFAIATTMLVLQPKSWASSGPRTALIWRPQYILPVVVFPLVASGIQIAFVVKYDAAQPTNDFHCDANHPEWVRFFSYAGTPFLLSIPCLYLSTMSVIRVFRTHRHLQRSRHPNTDMRNATPFPTRGTLPKEHPPTPRAIPSPSPSVALSQPRSPGREPLTPTLSSSVLSARKFHLPFNAPPLDLDRLSSFSSVAELDERESPRSSAFPTFAAPSAPPSVLDKDGIMVESATDKDEWEQNAKKSTVTVNSDKVSPLRWSGRDNMDLSKSELEFRTKENDEDASDDRHDDQFEQNHQYVRRSPFDMLSHKCRRPPPPYLAPSIARIILFQMTFSTVQVLASITTIIDVASHRAEPTPFGTQHIALLLAAWGPVFLFGFLPGVRRRMIFWRSSE